MNDASVIVAQNQRAATQALVDKLKKEGYTVVIEKQAGINDIKNVYAYKDKATAKQAFVGKAGEFEIV
jgi:NAD/NADP transhydrogenase alpha subunit